MAVELKAIVKRRGEENEGYENGAQNLSPSNSLEPSNDEQQRRTNHDDTFVESQGHLETHRGNCCTNSVFSVQNGIYSFFEDNSVVLWRAFWLILGVLYFVYFGFAMHTRFGDEGSLRLLVCTVFGVFLIALHFTWRWVGMPFIRVGEAMSNPQYKRQMKIMRWIMYVLSAVVTIVVLVTEVALKTPENLASLGGLAAFIIVSYLISTNPARVNWHPVYWGIIIQFFFALLILRTEGGFQAFKWIADRVTEFLAYTGAGTHFVFDNPDVHFFAFSLMPIAIFFSSFISILYYLGVMQAIVSVIGKFLGFCLGTTPAESISTAGNIFVGMVEAPMMIRPFLDKMTISEMHAMMTGGFATIAGGLFGAYVGFGVPANHLISASVMSAPAALAMSKLMCPETEEPMISADDYGKMESSNDRNLIDAIASGASTALKLIASIIVNLIAFLALLAFVDATLTWFGDRVGVERLTFELICSYVLYPVAYAMGTYPEDCRRVAKLVGIKTFTNEFIAYKGLKKFLDNKKRWRNYTLTYNSTGDWYWRDQDAFLVRTNETLVGGFLSARSEVIATYALCGFANIGSIGILLGGLSALVPRRKPEMSRIVVRAMIAGNTACFMTACIAGLFFRDFEDSAYRVN